MASALGELEFVLADATRHVIAVIRPVPELPRGGVPRWVNGRDCSGRNCIVVIGPDGAAGLVITDAKVLVEANALIGMVAPFGAHRHARLSYSDCTCGRRHRKCVCGARRGEVLHWFAPDGGGWTVVDDEQHELAHITLRPSATGSEHTGARPTRAMLARWGKAARTSFSKGPKGYALIEVGPGFDWRPHGLLVALAVLCDRHAYHRAFAARGAS